MISDEVVSTRKSFLLGKFEGLLFSSLKGARLEVIVSHVPSFQYMTKNSWIFFQMLDSRHWSLALKLSVASLQLEMLSWVKINDGI
jgi:hypothetical protein